MKKKATSLALGVTLSLSLGLGTVNVAAAADSTSTTAIESTINQEHKQQIIDVFNGINDFRASKGLAPVNFSVPVSNVAEDWSEHMAETNHLYHNPDYGKDPRITDNYSAAGEIIAYRWDTQGQGLVDQWINSPTHNQIMSTAQFDTIGVGIATEYNGLYDTNKMFGTVNFFNFYEVPTNTYENPQDFFNGEAPLDDGVTDVTTVAPTFNDKNGTYTIPTVEGVQYYVEGVAKSAGTYNSGWTRVDITASAVSDEYMLWGAQSWSHTFEKPVTVVTPKAPTFNVAQGTYTIPSTTGVKYSVGGNIKAAGTYKSNWEYVSVYAMPTSNAYELSGTRSWDHFFEKIAVTPKAPTYNKSTGAYKIPTTKGVQYIVNSVAHGGKNASNQQSISVTTQTTAPGYRLSGTTAWDRVF